VRSKVLVLPSAEVKVMAKADMQPLREQKLEGGAFGGATPLNIAAAAARWASLNRKVGPRDRRGSYFIFVHEASRIESTRYLLALFIMLLSVASAPLGSAVSGGTAKRDCRQHQPAICGSPGRRRRSCL